jgi:UDPglucose 6-dehydrogenase
MDVIIIGGEGFVGKEMRRLFPQADSYDIKTDDRPKDKLYDVAIVCVPTPMLADGSCDTTAVADAFSVVKAKLYVIRSTIVPVTMTVLERLYPDRMIVFSPEYVASSSPYPAPLADSRSRGFMIFGGKSKATAQAVELFKTVLPPTTRYLQTDGMTAEVIKYMENAFIATYVTFCNTFYDICDLFEVDYNTVREGFLLDPRMTPWWTYVYPNKRGWGGHCLPKDMSAIIEAVSQTGFNNFAKFLEAVVDCNESHKGRNKNV